MNTEPDGFLGAVLAAESVKGVKTLINGPGGCRSRTQILLKELIHEYSKEDQRCCSSKYFSRQSKLPCTYLNSNDMIMGSANKISDGLGSVLSVSDSDIVMIDTLGASVQVTDNENAMRKANAENRTIAASRYISSMSLYSGFDDTMTRIVSHLCENGRETKLPKTVNILGYNISDSCWEYGKREIVNLLGSIGIEVITFIGCGCTKEELKKSTSAELNVLIHPEFSMKTAKYYSANFDIPYLIPRLGSPIGYPSICSFIQEISDKFSIDSSIALKSIASEKLDVDKVLMNSEKILGGFRGCGCSITGIPSDVLPITKWMYEHLSIVPEHVEILGKEESPITERLIEFLRKIDCIEALDADPLEKYELIFTDGMTAESIKRNNNASSCVQIRIPYSFGTSLVNRSLVGTYGCRYILDEIINSRGMFYCGQPTMVDFR